MNANAEIEPSAEVPSAGLVVARGAGYGAALGTVFGVLVIPAAGLLDIGDDTTDLTAVALLTVLVAPFTAVFGLLYGAVAGLVAAGVMTAVPSRRRSTWLARPAVAVVAALTVAGISWLVFRPSMSVGANEANGHVIERAVLFYVYPGVSALIAGALVGHRLVAPSRLGDRSASVPLAT